jgi:hypothetical protein
MNPWQSLSGSLAGQPRLDDPACVHHVAIYDSRTAEDMERAVEICTTLCPTHTLDRCQAWARSCAPNELDGIVGGELYEWRQWRPRPTKSAAS